MAENDSVEVDMSGMTGQPQPSMGPPPPMGGGTGAGPTAGPGAASTAPISGQTVVYFIGDGVRSAAEIFEAYTALFSSFSGGILELGALTLQDMASQAILAGADTLFAPMRQMLEGAEEMGTQTMEVASIIEGMTGMTAAAIDMAGYDADNAALRMTKNAYEAVQNLHDAEITLANGVKVTTENFGDASDFLSSYSESALRDSRLYRAATDATTKDMLISTQLARRNLGLSFEEINQIMQHELSNTGKISGDFLKEYERTAIAVNKATGVPIEMITRDLNTMLADFSHFGMMSLDQMGALSATVSKLGMNISDVTRLADNFQSFDRAAQTMSNLAASTGVTLDTLELFELANTDQEQFIISLRDQLESQGLEFENMNHIQQRNLAAAFGLDPLVMKRLLSDSFGEIESAQSAIAKAASEMPPGAEEAFVASMKRLDQLSGEDFAKRYAGMKNVMFEYAASIERGYLASSKVTTEYVQASGQAIENYGARIQKYRSMMDEFSEKTLGPPGPPPSAPAGTAPGEGVVSSQGSPASPLPGTSASTTGASSPMTGVSPAGTPPGSPAGTTGVATPQPPTMPGVTATNPVEPQPPSPSAGTLPGTGTAPGAASLPGTTSAPAQPSSPTAPIEIVLRVEGTDGLVNTTVSRVGENIVNGNIVVDGRQYEVKVK